ncbi:IS110 family transposase [Paenibacillus sp. HWE-109]|uniref:IS110 family transposase n=2 Tax=Paenibacillus sp. HWE-109 TaxID=1306526 RepID=UPI001EE0E123|nr:IS110 family transposase [Paenibacillus sp. HWE-109]UKS24800.1 IS110 family transposase [Paenibacillus sp. HWE-109]UKS28788.1 IS110 family transposase [Paenibacillus sp. HWE-109]UKS28851.1 IS110 family transposase [Paenibacillus sp. HWE-109]UKS29328.1 IS110 family transposase [Paenibacillus sp. HWE-109]
MKFKQRHSENQRIERITTNHLIVGVDIAKEKHVARAVNFRGIEIGRPISFENGREGFEKLFRWIQNLLAQKNLTSFLIGLEPTGHYWFNLTDWLTQNNHEVVLVNPLTTYRNKENRDNSQSKNDFKDALVIADAVCRGFYFPYYQHGDVYQRIRMVMNDREYWVNQQTSLKNRIFRLLDIHFPEYCRVFEDWTTVRSLASLKIFPLPADVRLLTPLEMVSLWREKGGMKRAGGRTGMEIATRLIAAARNSVGSKVGYVEARNDLKRLLEDYERLAERLREFEQELEGLLEPLPEVPLLRSLKGLSTLMISALLAGCGDLSKYAHGQQILSQAGMNLVNQSSGKHQGKVTLSKRGRPQLRKYLYLAVLTLVNNHPSFQQWHIHNVQVMKMKKHRSIFKLIGKLARIIIGMVKRQEEFKSDMEQQQAA